VKALRLVFRPFVARPLVILLALCVAAPAAKATPSEKAPVTAKKKKKKAPKKAKKQPKKKK
jgi:hypothetical protein